ncbi:MAG: ATP-binding protein [Desulfobulbaceae bacterium]|nr:ATP-binding protein [Desulfobulbaceae bacterium]
MSIRSQAISLVLLIILILSTTFLWMSFRQQKEHLKQVIHEKEEGAHFLSRIIQEEIFANYKTRIISLATTKQPVLKAFAERDRKQLYKAALPFYNNIKNENKHFYAMHFNLPDGTVLLRMHNPDFFGDSLKEVRPMVMQVHQTHKQVTGYDIGRMGLFYRVIQPVFFQKKYIGSLEFGIRYQQLIELLQERISKEIVLAIKTENWQKATKIPLDNKTEADGYTLISFGHPELAAELAARSSAENHDRNFNFDGRDYSFLSKIELKNSAQETVANVYLALDITNVLAKAHRFQTKIISLVLVFLALASLVLYFSFGQLLKKILSLNYSLRQSNLDLFNSKSYVDNLLLAMSDGLLVTAPDDTITKCNPSICALLGYSKEELTSKKIFTLFKNQIAIKKTLTSSIASGRTCRNEFAIINRKNMEIPIIFSATPLFNDEKEYLGHVCVATEITDQKKTERLLRQAHDDLEVRVKQRTAQLADANKALLREMEEREKIEADLMQAQKMKAIGTLAGGIAHDFNNILTAILGYVELARYNAGKTDIVPFLNEVFKAGQRAKELVKQILTFSRQSEQEKKPILIYPIIKETLKLLRSSIPSNIEIKTFIDSECGPVMGDPTQIHQILMNLCTNAYQAMQEHGGILTVTLKQTKQTDNIMAAADEPGRYLQLAVTDTGAGMEKNTLERIFEPYFSTKEATKGTGLGLAVVHGIVTSYGGWITVNSNPGQGTTFTVYLPLCKTMPDHNAFNSQPAPLTRGNENILVIDDEQEIATLLKLMLTPLGYNITQMTDSTEAWKWFSQNPEQVDLVITDMTMPKITGTDLAKKMFSLRPTLPIILCTGYSDLINEEKAKEMGISSFIMKPIEQQTIAQTVRNCLDQR